MLYSGWYSAAVPHQPVSLAVVHQKTMNNKSKIIEFPYRKIKSKNMNGIDSEFDFEAGVEHQRLIDNEDYPGLVQFCKQRSERNPEDLYVQYYLGNAYFQGIRGRP